MSRNRFDDEFTVCVISSASTQIFGSNTLVSFRNNFNDENQLSGDWRVTLSKIIFPTKSEHVVNGDLIAYSLKGCEDSQKISSDANVISRPYNVKNFPSCLEILTIKINFQVLSSEQLDCPVFRFEIKISGKHEIIFGKYEGITSVAKIICVFIKSFHDP